MQKSSFFHDRPLLTQAQSIYQNGKSGSELTAARIIEVIPAEWWTPVAQHSNEVTVCYLLADFTLLARGCAAYFGLRTASL